jgi:threonine aldolase
MQRGTNEGPTVDLRSDTVTKPTPAMLERMVSAELGDDGQGGDPTVQALEAAAAKRLGKEAGLFLPSGTMSNQVAILTHARTRGEMIGEATSHIFRSELGGLSLLAGLYPRPLPGQRGAMDLDDLEAAIMPPAITAKRLGTAVVCVETTHNAAGGAVLPLDHLKSVQRMCRDKGVPLHLDGARLFNAAVALGIPAVLIAACADSATFCVSKGLSAPVGSVLTGTATFIAQARGFRRLLGGTMRQSGLLAACGLVALEDMVDRLAEDHARARALANGLKAIDDRLVTAPQIETNIVMVDVGHTHANAATWCSALSQYGVLGGAPQQNTIRFVTHRHIDDDAIDHAIAAFRDIYAKRPAPLFAM